MGWDRKMGLGVRERGLLWYIWRFGEWRWGYDVWFNWFIWRFELKSCNVWGVMFVGILYIRVFGKG